METLASYLRVILSMEAVREHLLTHNPERGAQVYRELELKRRELHDRLLRELGLERDQSSDLLIAKWLEEFRERQAPGTGGL